MKDQTNRHIKYKETVEDASSEEFPYSLSI